MDNNVFSIMVATDIHLGVNEKDGVRGEDSFTTFEEVLRISKERDVDFILLGGDLFHDNKPSPQCYYKCLALLRKYCMGEKPIDVDFLSDQNTVFKNSEFPIVNYEDPNLDVSIPVYSIHGNHDDPSGFGRMSALDLLSVSGYLNYFGKWTDLNQVKVHPLLLQKGSSKLAIYGLSHIKDERLYRLMKINEVEYVLPEDPENYFKIMVLHQNRVDRPGNKYIPESLLPSFIDLVVWGHEHDCRIAPEWNQENAFHVTQPGSTVATSLCEGEALPKSVAILEITGKKFKLHPIPLKTVRPFIFDSIRLSDWNLGQDPNDLTKKVQDYVNKYIRTKLLEKAKDLITDDPKQPHLPLIRLRIEYEIEEEYFNPIRFGQSFSGIVANPSDMILMKKKVKSTRQTGKGDGEEDIEKTHHFQDINQAIPDLMKQYFAKQEKAKMKVLGRISISEAVARFIDKDDKEALDDIVYHEMKKVRSYLENENADPDSVTTLLEKYNEMKIDANENEELEEVRRYLDSDSRRERAPSMSVDASTVDILSSDDDDDFGNATSSFNNTSSTSSRGRGRGAAKGRGTRARRRAATRSSTSDRQTTLDSSFSKLNTTSNSSSSRMLKYFQEEDDDKKLRRIFDIGSDKNSKGPSPKKFKFSDEG